MTPEPLSLRAFAASLGVSDTAIRKAEKAGRFGDAVTRDAAGKPSVVNPELAAERFRSTTRTGVGAATVATRERAVGSRSHGSNLVSLVDAQREATTERARKLRIDNDRAEGRLISVDQAKREAFDAERMIRESILNVPARLSGELAADTDPAIIFRKLDAALREALTRASDVLLETVH